MAEPLTIRKIVDRISAGDIRIPAFQRGFVWSPSQVAFLLDSIYKEFPIGTIFLWKTDERLKIEKDLGNYTLPEPKKDYPINYVLDGQQRLTSLFSVFQTELIPTNTGDWVDIYFDLKSDENLQESCFFALANNEADLQRHFPMKTIFDSVAYRKATTSLTDDEKEKIDKVQEKFKEALIAVQILETDDRGKVAIVFERINRSGTELDTYQLLTAWSWSTEFDLQEKFEELVNEIEPFGFGALSDDKDLQLKCCSGVISGEASPSAIMSLRGQDVRDNFEKIKNGIKGSIDFLRKELNIFSLNNLPYPSMIISLTKFFSSENANGQGYTNNQREELLKWFWRSNFSRRYTAGVTEKHKTDLQEVTRLKEDPDYKMSEIKVSFDENFFTQNQFSLSSINSKTFILMLAQKNPKSFISGANVDLSKVLKNVNRNEFHHIFPQKHLENLGIEKKIINQLTNMCFLNNADNQKIKDKTPTDYKKLIPSQTISDVMNRAICPINSLDLKYEDFLNKRITLLINYAKSLMKF